ncbi:MAG: hypothetical protein HY364_02480 [Candidatus Aenigmarchaeota archaeon]|nr:hypothetical protein [Candidatus Aenigmarchaeota archaeon]
MMVLFQFGINPAQMLGADFFNFLLPWVFTFVITFGLLDKLSVFGDLKAKANIALSLIFAFFVTAAAGPQMAAFFMSLLGNFVVLAVGILVLVMFLQMVGQNLMGANGSMRNWIILLIVLVVGAALFFSSGGNIPGLRIDSQTATMIFWGLILLAAVYFVTAEEKK